MRIRSASGWRAFLVGALAVVPLIGGAGTTPVNALSQWDQRNDGVLGMNSHLASNLSVSFTPTLTSLDTVQLCLAGFTFDTIGDSKLAVTIVRETEAGTVVLGTSAPATIPATNSPLSINYGTVQFGFEDAVTLVPGEQYEIRPVQFVAHAFAAQTMAGPTDPLGDGGVWFREGVTGTPGLDNAASFVAAPTCP